MIVTFLGILLAYRLFGRIGLYVWIAISIIIANIQVMKTIEIFGLVTAEGNIIYGTIFLAMDILGENHGKKAAYKGVMIGFFTLIVVTVLMQLTLLFVPHESDTLSPALESIFSFLPRIAFASITAYFLSQTLNIAIFHYIKKLTKNKHLWLRNNASTMISQSLDNVIFTYLAFVGLFGLFGWQQIFEWTIVIQIFVTSLVMKYIVAVADTPFIYWARRLKNEAPD